MPELSLSWVDFLREPERVDFCSKSRAHMIFVIYGADCMEELISRKAYALGLPTVIEEKGALAVSIANRWILGWPERVSLLLKAGSYLDCLTAQVEQEAMVLANESNLRHLARHEILQMYEIPVSPPFVTSKVATS